VKYIKDINGPREHPMCRCVTYNIGETKEDKEILFTLLLFELKYTTDNFIDNKNLETIKH